MSIEDEPKRPILIRTKPVIEKAVEWYSNNSELRAMICGVFFIGSPMDIYFATEGQKITQRRFMKALESLKEEMVKLEEEQVDKSFLESEEFYDLMLRMLERSVKTGINEKVKIFSKIIKGAIKTDSVNNRHNAQDFLDIISDLSLLDMRVANEIYNQQKDIPETFQGEDNELRYTKSHGWESIPDNLGITKTDFELAISMIARTGLIKEVTGTYYGYTGGGLRHNSRIQKVHAIH